MANTIDTKGFIGREYNGVVILEELGRGAVGAVFIGFQKSLKRKVAVKILPKKAITTQEVNIRFRDEAETVAILSHPNIVTMFDMGQDDEVIYQIMQLIDGSDLRVSMKQLQNHPIPSKRVLPPKRSLEIVVSMLDALGYAHDEGVVHRDIKPGNILLENKTHNVRIVDFGIAVAQGCERTETPGKVLGTPLYMAPEQLFGESDARCDIYSTGMVLFELLAGKLPLTKTSVEAVVNIKMNDPGSFFSCRPSQASAAIIPDLERVIQKALEPDLSRRYQSCRTMAKDLDDIRQRFFM